MAQLAQLPNAVYYEDWKEFATALTRQVQISLDALNAEIPYIVASTFSDAKAQAITSATQASVESLNIDTRGEFLQISISATISEGNVAAGTVIWRLKVNGTTEITSDTLTVPQNGAISLAFSAEIKGVLGPNVVLLEMAKAVGGDPTVTVEEVSLIVRNQRNS